MAPREIPFIKRPAMDFLFVVSRFPPQEVQRMPITVRLMMILSKSSNPIRRKNEVAAAR